MNVAWNRDTKVLVFNGTGVFQRQQIHTEALHITLSEGFTELADTCFRSYSRLVSVSLPETLATIGNNIFQDTRLREFFLPRGVTTIHYSQSFDRCLSIERVTVDPANQYFCDRNGLLYSKDMRTLCFCPPNRTEYPLIIPNGVRKIALGAFSTSVTLRYVILPRTIKVIDSYFFYYSEAIEKVVIMKCPDLIDFNKSYILDGTSKREQDIIKYEYSSCEEIETGTRSIAQIEEFINSIFIMCLIL